MAPSGALNRETIYGLIILWGSPLFYRTTLLLAVKNVKARRNPFPLPVQASLQYSEYTIGAIYSIIAVSLPIEGEKLESF